ncbi:MAG: hypothetical protein JWM19_7437 [Actinomycetia bacterium]|nr:hypothetical protein [Actinomycetes bacterium]
MLSSTLSASATRWGAALPGARTPRWTFELSGLGLGLTHAQVPGSGSTAIGTSGIPGTTRATGVAEAYGVERTVGTGMTAAKRRIQASNGLPTDNRKQYVNETRVNADGGGAPGPEPEREQALQQG